MKKIKLNLLIIIPLFIILLFSLIENNKLFNKIIVLNKKNKIHLEKLAHLSFNLDNIGLFNQFSLLVRNNENILLNDTLLIFCFHQYSCMDCVNYELEKNLKHRSVVLVSNYKSEYEWHNLKRSYPEKTVLNYSFSLDNKDFTPFYGIVINGQLRELFLPDLKKNKRTMDFFKRYGV